MVRSLPALAVLASLLLSCALAAQGKAEKGKPATRQGKPKSEAKADAAPRPGPDKDDPITKKDKVVAALDKFLAAHAPKPSQEGWRTRLAEPPLQTFAADREWFWHLATDRGELRIRLLPQVAPMHCTSAIYLTRAGFYDGLGFHRVIRGFMAQGGCPNGTGSGNAGYTMDGETSKEVLHDKAGRISTANEDGKPRTDGSQFFLTFAPAPHLDGKHTIFGEVVEGLDVLAAIDALGGEDGNEKPKEPITIVRAWITVAQKEGSTEPKAKDDGGASDSDEPKGKGKGKGKGAPAGKPGSSSGGK